MNLLNIILRLIGYALLTFIVELPVALLGFCRKKMVVVYCFLINMITNLTLNVMILMLSGFIGGYWIWVAILEVIVVIVETILWRWGINSFLEIGISWQKSMCVTVISNVISFLVGVGIYFFPFG